MNGEFIVLGHEGKIKILNKQADPWMNVNGYQALIAKNGIPQAPYMLQEQTDALIAVDGGLAGGDAIRLNYVTPEGNVSAYAEFTVGAAPDPLNAKAVFGGKNDIDSVQMTGLDGDTEYKFLWNPIGGSGPKVGYDHATGTTDGSGTFVLPLPFGTAKDGLDGATGTISFVDWRGNTSAPSAVITAGL